MIGRRFGASLFLRFRIRALEPLHERLGILHHLGLLATSNRFIIPLSYHFFIQDVPIIQGLENNRHLLHSFGA
ncbi:Os09g0326950 [Oryza sativa Japonica Group]|uniref:Os09g0326950 protein n=1 Tax=Oryza sativa subsp. japonica TaxID=39947 RepID=A0A0N7KQK7_ORYSJ|nr:hypothetical protein EE612_047000 [Oryza sativa]BAT07490.1 Os09g0326950 [Oryza sativa Japonica Group]